MRPTSHEFSSHSSFSLSNAGSITSSKLSTSPSNSSRRLASSSMPASSSDQTPASLDYGKTSLSSRLSSQGGRSLDRSSPLNSALSDHRFSEAAIDRLSQRFFNRSKESETSSSLPQRPTSSYLKKESGDEVPRRNPLQLRNSNEARRTIRKSESLDNSHSRSKLPDLENDLSSVRYSRPASSETKHRMSPGQSAFEQNGNNLIYAPNSDSSFNNSTSYKRNGSHANKAEVIDQQMFLQRLLQAHNTVDELLRSRGMSPEDERTYLRYWEQIPIIYEEMKPSEERQSSSASDSGLSLDNDSDQSQHADVITETETFEPPSAEEDAYTESNFAMQPHTDFFKFVWLMRAVKDKVHSKVRTSSTNTGELILDRRLKKATALQQTDKVASSDSVEKPQESSVQKRKETKRITQLSTFIHFQGPSSLSCRSSAEISIQHVSFYQIARALTEKQRTIEKSVRIHLRLTERAPAALQTSIVLLFKTKTRRICYDVQVPRDERRMRRSKTVDPSQLTRDRSPSVLRKTIPAHARKKDPINPIRIPENFLKVRNSNLPSHEANVQRKMDEELRLARGNLRRVPFNKTVSRAGLAVCWVDQSRSASSTQNAKPTPFKRQNSSKIPLKEREDQAKKEASMLSQAGLCSKERRNEKHSVDSAVVLLRSPPSTKADSTKTETSTPLDVIDSRIVSEYRRNKVIPIPKTVKSSVYSSVYESRILDAKPVENPVDKPSPVKFLRRRTPERISFPPVPVADSKMQKCPAWMPLRKSAKVAAQEMPASSSQSSPVAKSLQASHNPFGVSLKRVDRHQRESRSGGAITQLTPKKPWVPKWRRIERSEENSEEEEDESQQTKLGDSIAEEDDQGKIGTRRAQQQEKNESSMTEAEKAMFAAKKRHEEEQAAKLLDYEERRRKEREKEEEELRKLKEKQEHRRQKREEEEREFAERRHQEEERRKREEDERKARIEAEKRKKEEEKLKKQKMMATAFTSVVSGTSGGRNFVLPTKSERADKFGNIVQAKQEMSLTKEQQGEVKRNYLSSVRKTLDISNLSPNELKNKIRILHQRICKLEADKYDLEKRHERQEYDLKELNERQRHVARNKALKKGIDPLDAASSRHPKSTESTKQDQRNCRKPLHDRRESSQTDSEQAARLMKPVKSAEKKKMKGKASRVMTPPLAGGAAPPQRQTQIPKLTVKAKKTSC